MDKEKTFGDLYQEFFDKVSLCETQDEIMVLSDELLDNIKHFFPEEIQNFITSQQMYEKLGQHIMRVNQSN